MIANSDIKREVLFHPCGSTRSEVNLVDFLKAFRPNSVLIGCTDKYRDVQKTVVEIIKKELSIDPIVAELTLVDGASKMSRVDYKFLLKEAGFTRIDLFTTDVVISITDGKPALIRTRAGEIPVGFKFII